MRGSLRAIVAPVHTVVIALFVPLGLILATAPWLGSVGLLVGYGAVTIGLLLGIALWRAGRTPLVLVVGDVLVALTALGVLVISGQAQVSWFSLVWAVMAGLAVLGAAAAILASPADRATRVTPA